MVGAWTTADAASNRASIKRASGERDGEKAAARSPLKLGHRSDRQLPNAFARERENGVADRRPDRWRARFADAARRVAARHDVHLDDGHLVHAQHLVIVEVALLHAALVDRDLALERGGQSVHDPTL